jgi:hypothetical protein
LPEKIRKNEEKNGDKRRKIYFFFLFYMIPHNGLNPNLKFFYQVSYHGEVGVV